MGWKNQPVAVYTQDKQQVLRSDLAGALGIQYRAYAFGSDDVSFLLARSLKPEYAVMRIPGESRMRITLKALLEQFTLCLGGALLGAAAVWLVENDSFNPPSAL